MALTRFLAKLLGLWLILAVLSLIANRAATIATMNSLFADPALLFITGVFTVVIGLAMVIGHNRWSGGAVAIVVTLYGWVALLKGLFFLFLPPSSQAAFYQALHFGEYFYGYFVVALVLGGYLTYEGFKPSRPPAFAE